MDSQTPTTFAKTELERALSEQSFGISSYEIVTCTELEASAVVTLLEGKTVSISLTPRGYTSTEHSADDHSPSDATFETIEDLLRSTSGLYNAAHMQALLYKLSEISAGPASSAS